MWTALVVAVLLSGATVVVEGGLVGYWSFDNPSPDTPKTGYCGRLIPDAVRTANADISATGKLGQSVDFGGGDMNIGSVTSSNPTYQDASDEGGATLLCVDGAIGSNPLSGKYSWAAFMIPPSPAGTKFGDKKFIDKEGVFECQWKEDDKFKCKINDGQTDAQVEKNNIVPVPVNADWGLYGMTYDSSQMSVWINTVETTGETSTPFIDNPNIDLILGNDFVGFIDEFYIFDHALSQAEWNILYNSGSGISPTIPDPKVREVTNTTVVDGNQVGQVTTFEVLARSSITLRATRSTDVAIPGDWGVSWTDAAASGCSNLPYNFSANGDELTITVQDQLPLTIPGFLCTNAEFPGIAEQAQFAITVQPLPPIILSDIDDVTLFNDGQPVVLALVVDGVPLPDVTWQKQYLVNCTINATCPTKRSMSAHIMRHERFDSALQTLVNDHPWLYDKELHTIVPRNEYTAALISERQNVTTTIVWQTIGTGASFQYSPTQANDSGAIVRAEVSNSFGQRIVSSETTLTFTSVPISDGSDGNGDGGDGDGDGTAAAAGGAAGAAVAVTICLAACILCICLLACIVIVSLVVFAAVRFRSDDDGAIRVTRPDFEKVVYGVFLDPPPSSKNFSEKDDLERLLVEMSPGLPMAILDACDTADLDVICASLMYIAHLNETAADVLICRIESEARSAGTEGTLFRSNSAAAKCFTRFAQLVACEYVWRTLAKQVYVLNHAAATEENEDDEDGDSMTINLSTMVDNMDLNTVTDSDLGLDAGEAEIQILSLQLTAQKVLGAILSSSGKVPGILCSVLGATEHAVHVRTEFSDLATFRAIGGFLFLRCYCPALMAPHVWGLLPDPAHPAAQRSLILLAKVLQNLANNTLPGRKEAYMEPLDSFVTSNVPKLQRFYSAITVRSADYPRSSRPANVADNALSNIWEFLKRRLSKVEGYLPREDAEELSSLVIG